MHMTFRAFIPGADNARRLVMSLTTVLLCQTSSLSAQRTPLFGANANITDPAFLGVLSDPGRYRFISSLLPGPLVQVLRFPGGNLARYYLWGHEQFNDRAVQFLNDQLGQSRHYALPLDTSLYARFLDFCDTTGIRPLITLNTDTYVHDNQVEPLGEFTLLFRTLHPPHDTISVDWPTISQTLARQVVFTHQHVGNPLWELGNEDYLVYDPFTYASIATRYIATIKHLYPDDPIILTLADSYGVGKHRSEAIKWNSELLGVLQESGILRQIDYIGPHLYYNTRRRVSTVADLRNLTKSLEQLDPVGRIESLLPPGIKKKLFITEFAVLQSALDNKDYSTQAHAMGMLAYLMILYSHPSLRGLIHQGFLQRDNALVFSPETHPLQIFGEKIQGHLENGYYVTPEGRAAALFLATVGDSVSGYWDAGKYIVLRSELPKGTMYQVLSLGAETVSLGGLGLASNRGGTRAQISAYVFDKLESHVWVTSPKNWTVPSVDLSRISVAPNSFVAIKVEGND